LAFNAGPTLMLPRPLPCISGPVPPLGKVLLEQERTHVERCRKNFLGSSAFVLQLLCSLFARH
jgi:hypothetical protein